MYHYNADPIKNSTSFKNKCSIIGKTRNNDNDDDNTKDVEIVVPLKHLSNFWRTLYMPLFNFEVSLALTWSKDCVLADVITTAAGTQGIPLAITSTQDDNELFAKLTAGFTRTIKWNKYRSEMTNQVKTNKLNYSIDPKFSKVNRLFVLSFKNEGDRESFSKYYTPSVEIKNYNVVIECNNFFDFPMKSKEEIYEKIIEMGKNNDHTPSNLLDEGYFSSNYKLIAIDLRKQN